jgi:hypothetical protein
MILFFCCFEIPFITARMWASCINYPAPGEAEKRVCAAFGFEWAAAFFTALKLKTHDVDFAEIISASPTNP